MFSRTTPEGTSLNLILGWLSITAHPPCKIALRYFPPSQFLKYKKNYQQFNIPNKYVKLSDLYYFLVTPSGHKAIKNGGYFY